MNEFSYPRQLRLLTGGDFKQVFSRASLKVSDKHLLILARPNELEHSRVGFVFSKKNIRLAVNRNRVRRIIRESFRLNQHKLPNVDIVILARPGLGNLDNSEVQALISRSWNRLIGRAKAKSDKTKSNS
ncbi:ribonuclease P protein component [Amphritea sp. 1_MG-2023]|uniref:ribonuclease P protein component n=1 Tax=Amphritea sp. 1_MG-2023 TaxID=3062670 RepID=UPI0026E38D1E|nr:ribonuclease P protein component [Amphritea sp. 1_MG-2023]MDO6562372.1 ribonuclease P protein component [Amphritea sp. 1_MG-2023]